MWYDRVQYQYNFRMEFSIFDHCATCKKLLECSWKLLIQLQNLFDPILAKNLVHTAHYSKFMLDGQYLLSHITSNFRSYNGLKYIMKRQPQFSLSKLADCSVIPNFDLQPTPWYTDYGRPGEEIAFTARPKIKSQSQIFRYGRSIFCLPHRPNFSDIFDLCLHWVSVVRAINHNFLK